MKLKAITGILLTVLLIGVLTLAFNARACNRLALIEGQKEKRRLRKIIKVK